MRTRNLFGVLVTAFVVGVAGNAYAVPSGTVLNAGAPDTVPGLYIVGLHGGVAVAATTVDAEAGTLTDRYGGTIRNVYSAALRGFAVRMSEGQARRLAADPSVEFVQQSLWVRRADVKVNMFGAQVARAATSIAAAGEQPNPPSWGLDRIDGVKDNVYKYPNTGTGVTVYNTDSELNTDHASFEGRAQSGYDFVDEDSNVNECKNQFDQGHGTHTGGTSSSETYGVAKDVTIVGVKVLGCDGNAPDADSIQGVDWVTQNARKPAVANASWTSGGANADPEGINRAVKNSIASGIVWAVAAGNDNGGNACTPSPAKVPEAITVASTDSNDSRSSFSNIGSCVDIFAPGGNITSASNSNNTGSKGMSGTSMAAPHVAGAAALYLSANPNATPQQVRDALVSQAQEGKVQNPGAGSPNKLLDVSKIGGGTGGPAASFTANCSAASLSCSFDGSGSTGTIASYAWDFGDSQTGTRATPSHTYAQAGTYTVKLTVTDDAGKTGSTTKQVQAGAPPAGQPPKASFTVQCQWSACSFNGSGSTDPDGDIASYAWTFGDGKTGSGVTATNSYANTQKTYTAELKVTDRAGASNTVSKQIQCWSVGAQAFCFSQ
ncbi:S8 family serine peptidase [Kribbella sandramycini]|uniref:S8 family serine peptidase n=1 Tax=Kribbella sandramycini TaxID=60450 RepID=A0A7Y4KXS7_9ACTN|nr:S8 family serine peptidase [Kribbella sandramycini]MBB6569581.1 subtilisin family serine protease [Kribbella sandramycini]NOL40585.1 S8 family serine peptidase [Kribbella sandramycini]